MKEPIYLNPRISYYVMAVALVLDQITKILTRAFTQVGESHIVLGNLFGETFRFTHLNNTGAAFSMSLGNPLTNRLFFIAASLLAIGFIIFLMYHATHRIQLWAFGLVLGGAIGNLVDRIFLGGVTDFIDVDIPRILGMERFPVFNIADSVIFIAMCLLIIDMIFVKDKAVPQEETPLPHDDMQIDNKEL